MSNRNAAVWATCKTLAGMCCLALLIVSCDFAPIGGAGSGDIDVEMTGIPAMGAKAPFANVTSVEVKVVQKSDGSAAGSGTLTYNETSGSYKGSLSITGSGDLVFVGLAKNTNSEVLYLGNGEMLSGGNNVTIVTGTTGASGTALGMRGPAGGWIYHAKEAYTDNWRFLEAARADLSLDWTEAFIDTVDNQIINGDVYDRSATPVLQLSKYDWYWGPAGSAGTSPKYTLSTTAPTGDGYANTFTKLDANLDATSAVTPKLKKGKGRKTPATGVDNIRRDTPDTLKTWTVNGIGGWFIPSMSELDAMYTTLKASSKGNFESAYYWSSTEDLTADQWTIENLIEVPNGNARNFETSSASEEKTRDTPYRVRPSRKF